MLKKIFNFLTFGYYNKYQVVLDIAKESQKLMEIKKYSQLKAYDLDDAWFVDEIQKISENPAYKYFVFYNQMQVVNQLKQVDTEHGNQCIGMLKFSDMMNANMERIIADQEVEVENVQI